VLRVVCRNGFSADLGGLLMGDLESLLPELRSQSGPMKRSVSTATAFHH
jgi:glutamate decarboxylase